MRANLLQNILVGLCVLAFISVALAARSRSAAGAANETSLRINTAKKTDLPWQAMACRLMGSVSL